MITDIDFDFLSNILFTMSVCLSVCPALDHSISLRSVSALWAYFLGQTEPIFTSSCWNDEHFCKSFTKLQSKCQKKKNSNNIMIRNKIFHDFSQERIRKYSFLMFFQGTAKGIVKRKNSHKRAPWSVGEVDTETIENVWHPLLKKNRT